uniref:Uncharacterized protein n=1 Tax=Arundo donax TaxID=35708 RepID=A0A0A9E8Z9_ARUDO
MFQLVDFHKFFHWSNFHHFSTRELIKLTDGSGKEQKGSVQAALMILFKHKWLTREISYEIAWFQSEINCNFGSKDETLSALLIF